MSKIHNEIKLNLIFKIFPEAFTQKSTLNFSPIGAFVLSASELLNATD